MTLLRYVVLAILLIAVPALGLRLCSMRLGVAEFGVRQNQWTGEIEAFDRGVGLHAAVPGIHSMRRISGRAQLLVLGGAEPPRPPLELRTRDDNMVRATVTVLWRVRPGRAHALVRAGSEATYVEQLAAAVEDVLRAEFAQLSSEEWFDPALRAERLGAARPQLERAAEELELEVLDVFAPHVAFSSEYEARLQAGQILAQQRQLELAKDTVAASKADLAKAEETTRAAEKESRAMWTLERTSVLSTAELERRIADQLGLDGEAIEKLAGEVVWGQRVGGAEAEVAAATDEARRLAFEALAQNGGRILLARRAAQGLRLESVELDSADPRVPLALDLDALQSLLLGALP